MATGYYQTPQAPRLYVSYLLYAYATGGLGSAYGENITDEEAIQLIQLDPTNYLEIEPADDNHGFWYKLVPDYVIHGDTDYGKDFWNFNYAMVLGHNMADLGAGLRIFAAEIDPNNKDKGVWSNKTELSSTGDATTIKNFTPFPNAIHYNGWSALEINQQPTSDQPYFVSFNFDNDDYQETDPYFFNSGDSIKVGTFMLGKYWDAPQNVDLNTSLSYSYGVKQKTTKSGKSLTNINWTKPNSWVDGNEPFGLTEQYTIPRGDSHHRKTGKRTWKMNWTSLEPKYVMNQNPMLNSLGWENKDNYQTDFHDNSLYNIKDSNDGDSSLGDFYTDVIHKTLGGSLPMVLQLDKNDASPSNMAIVKMTKPPTITQKSPNLYNISITLEEQI